MRTPKLQSAKGNGHPKKQGGAVLVVSLLLLLIMTILALSATQSTRLQERMAGNARDSDLAFQSSEAGLRGAEVWLQNLVNEPIACAAASFNKTTCPVYQTNTLAANFGSSAAIWWSTSNSLEYGVDGTQDLSGVAADPRYIVEDYATIKDTLTVGEAVSQLQSTKKYYRLTASGVDATSYSQAVVQSTYARRF